MSGIGARAIPCVLMRAGTSRGPFFLAEWLPSDADARDEALIGAIGASDLLQLDGVGGGSTLTSKVAIVSRSKEPGCDVDYLFAQVGVGQRSVDTRPNCGNMLSGVGPFAIEQRLVEARDGETVVHVFNVNTRSRIDVTVMTPGRRVVYDGAARIDGVAGTASPIRLDFLDAWGSVTGALFPTTSRIDRIDGLDVTCIDAAMPLMIARASDFGLTGRESPIELDADALLLARLETMRREAGARMGLGDVTESVVPKPVLLSPGDDVDSVTSRYFTPRRCHASHAVTGAIGVATAFAMPGTVASGSVSRSGHRDIAVLHPQGRIDVAVDLAGDGASLVVERAALVRTARKILEGQLHLPAYVFSPPAPVAATRDKEPITIVVPTASGGGNDAIARLVAARLGPLLGTTVAVDNRSGSDGTIASEHVARATPDGRTLMLGYIGTHAMKPALETLRYDPVDDFEPIGLVAESPTLLVVHPSRAIADVAELVAQAKAEPDRLRYASAGNGTAPHFAAELFNRHAGTALRGVAFNGSAPALHETMAGDVDLMFPSLMAAAPLVKTGRLRALAFAHPRRVDAFPLVPTLDECGVHGVEMVQWYGLFAPRGTPHAVVERTAAALAEVLAQSELRTRIVEHGGEVRGSTPDALRALVAAERDRWRAVAREVRLVEAGPLTVQGTQVA